MQDRCCAAGLALAGRSHGGLSANPPIPRPSLPSNLSDVSDLPSTLAVFDFLLPL